jgi:hypothetical protein
MTIELNNYGFEFDTYWCYIAISWPLLIVTAAAVVAYKIYKNVKS